jgi:hypothetical protein
MGHKECSKTGRVLDVQAKKKGGRGRVANATLYILCEQYNQKLEISFMFFLDPAPKHFQVLP